MIFEYARWEKTTKGTLGFVMFYDDVEERLRFFVGIAEGLNERIDINHIYAGGFELPLESGIPLFFGDWDGHTTRV